MPPQQFNRLLDFFGGLADFSAHSLAPVSGRRTIKNSLNTDLTRRRQRLHHLSAVDCQS
jgi:hypothetical protein